MIAVFDTTGEKHPLSGYTNYRIRHKADGEDQLSFYMATDLEQYQLLREEGIIHAEGNEYLIKKINDNKIDCVLNFDFLKARAYYDYKSETRTLLAVLTDHLPTGWTIEGAGVSTIRRTITFDACTDYDVIKQCQKTYAVRFMWHILDRRLVVVDPDQMNPTGEYITSELNLQSLSFKGESTSFATRLYAYGKDGMTMEDAIVNGSRYGKTYVENRTFADKVVCVTWVDERYTVPENLYADSAEKLSTLAWPVRSYTCRVIDMAKQDARYSFLTFSMWRKVTLIDVERQIRVEHQIVQYDEYPEETDRNDVTLSCVPDTIQDRIRQAEENGGEDAAARVQRELETFINETYAGDLEEIQEQLDGKAETWYQAADPSLDWTTEEKPEHTGDLWYRTTDSTTWRWNGTAWTQQNVPDAVFNKIEGKAQVFIAQPVPPYNVGDLWVQGNNGDIMRCATAKTAAQSYAAGDWIKASKYTDDSALTTWLQNTYANDKSDLQSQIDGKVQTFSQAADPATSWTASDKAKHVGDLWYNTTSQKYYRYTLSETTYSWTEITATPPASVVSTINSKAQIFVAQPTPPYGVGDLWVQGENGDILRCTTGKAAGAYFSASDWIPASKYTDDSAVEELEIGGVNLLAVCKGTEGQIINSGGGLTAQSGSTASDFIEVTAGKALAIQIWSENAATALQTAFYNSSKEFVAGSYTSVTGLTPPVARTATVPTGAAYVRFSFPTADQIKVEHGAKFTSWSQAPEDIENRITVSTSAVSEELAARLNMATAMMTSAFGSHFIEQNGELFMMDDEDPAQAQIVWRWNINGFAKSSTGIDGPYTTALTFDDTFLTGVIDALIIRGDLIEANSISAEKIQQGYTDGVLSQAFTAAQGYVQALFTDLNNYLSNTDGTGQLDVLQQDIAAIQATINGLNIDFSEAFRGGINYAHNSAGLNGLSDDWTVTGGTVVTMQSSDTKNSTVSNSCFRLSVDAVLTQTIDTVVLGQPYTISAKVKKTGSLLSEVYVVYNGNTVGKLFSSSDSGYSWQDCHFTIDSIQSNTLQIVAMTRSDYLYLSDVMVCEGVTTKAWTPAPDEIYTSGVNIDKRGITVYRSGTQEKTVISNEEFAGYNGEEEIFSLNGDETRINNAIVRKKLRIEDTMFIPFESGAEKGLNVALVD